MQFGGHQDCESSWDSEGEGCEEYDQQVKESVTVPVVANGDIRCEEDVYRVAEATKIDGKQTFD